MGTQPLDRVLTMAEKLSLGELGKLRRALDELIWDRVQEQRADRVTWGSIASELHISPSEAHRRYAPSRQLYPLPADTRAYDRSRHVR